MARTIGYARTASSDGDIDAQIDELKAAGCETVYCDPMVGGNRLDRPGFDQLLADAQPGDRVMMVSRTRLARDVGTYSKLALELQRNGITLTALDDAEEYPASA